MIPAPSPDRLLDWYDRHARRLPWRTGPRERKAGIRPDPYRVWLSEIMLQQTNVTTVKPYYEDFLARWPTVEDLAGAAVDDVMRAWAGLGYYSRARNLKACADRIAAVHGGVFPRTSAALRELPGIGDYTAAAIAAIAYDEPAPVVDGNVERVLARIFRVETPLPAAKRDIRRLQTELTPQRRSGDYAQALMDLGATICTPKRSACSLCPWEDACAAHAAGVEEVYPRRGEKADRPERRGAAYVAIRADGAVLLRKRAEKGLLGGMAEVPGSDWTLDSVATESRATPPFAADWSRVSTPVIHVFTHFRLTLDIFAVTLAGSPPAPTGHWWSAPSDLPHEALPSVMRKAIEAALPGATKKRK